MSESVGPSSDEDQPTSADHATPDLPTGTPCASGDTGCEDDDDYDDEKPDDEKSGDEKPGDDEETGDDEEPEDDEANEDDENPGDNEEPGDEEPGDDDETEDPSSTHTTLYTNEDGEVCTPLTDGEIVTVYSIIYTETLTWTDDPSDYTAPFPEMPTPTYCDPVPTTTSSSSTTSKPKLTSVPSDDDGWNTYCASLTNGTQSCTSEPIFNPSFIFTSKSIEVTRPLIGPPEGSSDVVTSTFYITSKNPTVVFPPQKTPDYGQDSGPDPPYNPGNGNLPAETHAPADPRPPQSAAQHHKITITADPSQVIIGDHTIKDLDPGATTKVTIGGNEYEINPSQIIQAGGRTVNRPGAGQAYAVADPITTIAEGLAITVSGSQAVIGGYTYTIGSTPSTEIVQGRTVIISPTGISFKGTDKGVSYKAAPPEQTGIIVAGGEMLTAIGPSVLVILETTITYGPGTSPQTETVDDDTIVADEHGVALHGSTIGGDTMEEDETRYEVVGGATLTRVGASKMVIRDVTYTVGPGTGTTTTAVGGEDVTVAPDGVTVDTLTVPYPFGATVVTAIPAPTTDPSPQETEEEEEEDGAGVLRVDWAGVCIAIGAWVLL